MNKIRDYLKSLEEEQKEMTEKEKLLEKKDDSLVNKEKDAVAIHIDEKVDTSSKDAAKSVMEEISDISGETVRSEDIVKKEEIFQATPQKSEDPSAPLSNHFTVAKSQDKKDNSKEYESALIHEMEKNDLPEITPEDIASDLFDKTELVLRKYSPAYVAQNIENAMMMLTLLEKTASMLPFNVDFELRGNIDHNISKMREIVATVDMNLRKQEDVNVLEDYLHEVDKALRRYSKQQITKNLERAQYEYNVLLQKRKSLPEGNPTYEMVVSKRLEEFESRIMSIVEINKVKRTSEELDASIKEFLRRSESEDFEILKEEYRNMLAAYRFIEEELERNKQSAIKEGLYHCKLRLQKRRKIVEQEQKQRKIVEESEKREQYRGIRTFWREYVNDLRMFNDTVTVASPSQYFTLYERYNKLLALYSNLASNELITPEESRQADDILSTVERKLEVLRQNI